MYSTANTPSAVTYVDCSQPAEQSLVFPEEEEDYECPDVVPPVNWQKKQAKLHVDDRWALNGVSGNGAASVLGLPLGQVTAVQAHNGHVYILHRGVVVWDYKLVERWAARMIYLMMDDGYFCQQLFQPDGLLHWHS